MGALIFLLLVITQKIQKQSQLPVVFIESPLEEVVPPPEFPVVNSVEDLEKILGIVEPILVEEQEEVDENEPILPLLAGNSLEENEQLQADWNARQARLKAEYETRLKAATRKQEEFDQQWNEKVAELNATVQQLDKQRKEMLSDKALKQRELEQLQAEQKRILETVQEKQQQLDKLNSLTFSEKDQSRRLQNRAAELTRQIARLENKIASLPPETEIVAYDSLTGTARKPILIECRRKEIIFVAEGVVLTAEDLSGFPTEYNPLLAGAEALVKYWSQKQEDNEKPYILLIVRPEGTTGFYIARGLLSKLDYRFGYELVDTKTDIKWSTTEPDAIRACEEAVASVLENRNRVAAKTGRLAATQGPLNYSNRAGEFHIPELNSSKRSGKGNFLGDEKWLPPSRKESPNIPRISPEHPQSQQQPSIRSEQNGASKNSSDQLWTGTPPSTKAEDPQRVFGFDTKPGAQGIQRPPAEFVAPNAKPLREPETPAPLPDNPFESKEASTQSEGGSSTGIRVPKKQGSIGIERELEIHLWSDRIQIDEQLPLKVPNGTSPADLKSAMTSAIAKSTSDWGAAPQAYFWKPVVKIVIHPGGLLHYTKAKELAQDWDVPSNIEYELK